MRDAGRGDQGLAARPRFDSPPDRRYNGVHDDPAAARLMARHLEGYRVVGMPNERDVLGLVEGLHPRAVVTTPRGLCSMI